MLRPRKTSKSEHKGYDEKSGMDGQAWTFEACDLSDNGHIHSYKEQMSIQPSAQEACTHVGPATDRLPFTLHMSHV